MEDNVVKKIITNAKNMFSGKKKSSASIDYAFSPEEIAEINKTNKQKITKLQEDLFETAEYQKNKITLNKDNLTFTENAINNLTKKAKEKDDNSNEDVKKEIDSINQDNKEDIIRKDSSDKDCKINKDITLGNDRSEKEENATKKEEETTSVDTITSADNISDKVVQEDKRIQNSYINLSAEHQKIVMDKWQAIDINILDKDILFGKDLLNHNYAITYADDAARFVHKIRKDYEIVICYLIGFNNEKKGIYDKTIFSNHVDNEWKYLNNYIKILEKIRSFKK